MRTLLAVGVVLLGTPVRAADPPAKNDRYGDSLPPGAITRLGTLRNRAPIASFGIQEGDSVITVSPAGHLRLWQANRDAHETLIALPTLEPNGMGDLAQVSPDGRFVAARVNDKLVVWDVSASAKLKPKEVASFDVPSAKRFCFSPDGSALIAASGSESPFDDRLHSAYLCALKTVKATKLEGAAVDFSQVAFSGDGKRAVALATTRQGNRYFFWNTENGKQLSDCKLEGRGCEACALNHKGDLLVAWVELNNDRVWHFFDPLTGKKRDDLIVPKGIRWVSFAPDDKTLLASNALGVQWWDPVEKKLLRHYQGNTLRAPARFSPDGTTLVATGDELLFRWDVKTGKPLFESQTVGHASWVFALGVASDSKLIATQSFWPYRVCVWDASTGKQLWQAPAYDSHSRRLDFSPDDKFLYVPGENENEIYKRDVLTGKILQKYTTDPKMGHATVYSTRVSSDGKTLTAVMGLRSILIWETESGKLLKTGNLVSDGWSFDLSPDGSFFVSNGDSGALARPVADQTVNHLKDAGFRIRHPGEFSADGKLLMAIVSTSGPVDELFSAAVISTKTWKVVGGVSINKNGWAALSPDGKTLAVAQNERLEFYTVETGKLIGGYDVPAGDWKKSDYEFTQVLRFTPDGKKLITGHSDTTALIWPVPELPAR